MFTTEHAILGFKDGEDNPTTLAKGGYSIYELMYSQTKISEWKAAGYTAWQFTKREVKLDVEALLEKHLSSISPLPPERYHG